MRLIKEFAKKIFRSFGLDLKRVENSLAEDLVLKRLLRTVRPVAVLDVGANTGQYANLVWRCGYEGFVVSFEATLEARARLISQAERRPRWIVAPLAAVGSHVGNIDINISANSVSSSILPMNQTHRDAAPGSEYVSKQNVTLDTLDALAEPLVPKAGPLYLKIDTQGYEREVLNGASKLLPRIAAIQVELSLVPLYEGGPTVAEMLSLLDRMGFELYEIVPGFKDERSGRLLQIDGFFITKQASV